MSSAREEEESERAKYVQELNAFRRAKDQFFGTAAQSPVPAAQRNARFSGLSYYPPDPAYRVVATVVPYPAPEIVQLATSTGEPRTQARYAQLRFQLAGQTLHLAAFADPAADQPAELFVPFRDATSGGETYGAGRYVEVEVEHTPDGAEHALLDFNLAYNPYCAYSEFYSCPIPPAENRLPIAIRAGERVVAAGH